MFTIKSVISQPLSETLTSDFGFGPHIVGIQFNTEFNHPVNKTTLPPHITKLCFGHYFNQPLDDLHDGVTKLSFGQLFNQPLNKLPPNVTHIKFYMYGDFNRPIDNLPIGLKHLTLPVSFKQSLNNLPDSLEYLSVSTPSTKMWIIQIPPAMLKCLYINTLYCNYNNIPIVHTSTLTSSNISYLQKMCKTNKHNLAIKQTPFYDIVY